MSNTKAMSIISAFQVAQSRKRKAVPELVKENVKNHNLKQTNECKINTENCFDNQETVVLDILKEVVNKVTNNELCTVNSCAEKLVNGHVEDESDENRDSLNSTLDKSINLTDNDDELLTSEKDSSLLTLNSSAKSSDFNSPMAGPSSSNLLVPSLQKKRRRMSPAEAKRKTELRAMQEKLKEEKRLAKEAEKLRRENDKKLAKLQKQQKREEEEKEKEKLRQEKKEQEEKERQQKQVEREERLKLKLMIQEAKAEEKKKKEQLRTKQLEDKLKAIEEKKKLDEEKIKMELEKEKQKAKTKQAFEKFFVKSSTSSSSTSSPLPSAKESVFLPFQVSEDMILAPVIPVAAKKRFDKEQLDLYIENQDCKILYIEMLKSNNYEHVRYKKIKPNEKNTSMEDVIIIDVEPAKEYIKPKLLQFHENIRPPYWGTWRKKSKNIGPRKPFGHDAMFDYEVDSEEEWDEGGPGESLTGTEDEESEDDYEVDNEFFVPHGYLSAEEEGEDEAPVDPEAQKARLKMKEKEFLSARNKKTTELKPIILGCYFEADGNKVQDRILLEFTAEILSTKEVLTAFTVGTKMNPSEKRASTSPNENKYTPSNMRPVPEDAYPYFIRLLHGNTNGRPRVIKEFQNFWFQHCKKKDNDMEIDIKDSSTPSDIVSPNTPRSPIAQSKNRISKRQLARCITSIATWCKPQHPTFKKLCWWVKDDVIQKYGLRDLPVPNEWIYTTTKASEDTLIEQSPVAEKMSSSQ